MCMRCAAYIRVSTDRLEQKQSLANQKDLFFSFIKEKGWDVFDFYVDVESGTTDKREQLQRLIQDAKEKKFDVIVAKELSRLARNGQLSYQIRDIAEQSRIHIITLDNAINTLEGNNQMFGLFAWMYEQESQRTSNRIKSALKSRASAGNFGGSNPPYGYELNDGKLNIKQDNTPSVVKRIFQDYLSGKGFDSIARDLYNEGLPTPAKIAGKRNASDKWQGSTIRLILSNPHYTGDLVQGRQTSISVTNKMRKTVEKDKFIIVKDAHPPIISRSDYQAVQELMDTRKRKRPPCNKHLFTDFAFCADCGKGMHYKKNRKGYICGSYNKHGKKACSEHLIKESDLKKLILTDIRTLFQGMNKSSYADQLNKKLNTSKLSYEKKKQSIQIEIEKLNAKKIKLINLLADDMITKDEYQAVIEANNSELKELFKKQQEVNIFLEDQHSTDRIKEFREQLDHFLTFKELTPEMLYRLINRIEFNADEKVKIFYRFSLPTV